MTASIERLCMRLGMPYLPESQDFGIENADGSRVHEFLSAFEDVEEEGKYALMDLVLASFEELCEAEGVCRPEIWDKIEDVVRQDPGLYWPLLDTWTVSYYNSLLPSDERKDYFVTPLAARLLKSIQRGRSYDY